MKRTFAALILLIASLLLHAPAWSGLAEVRAKGRINFAMSGQYPPFNFVDEKNELTGFDVAVCSEIARRIGVEPRPLSTAWDGIVAGLLAGKYDLICGSMAITEKRLQALDFSDPYYRSGAQIFVAGRSGIDSAEELKGRKVGVTLGTTYEEWVRENIPGAEILTYKGVPDMVLEVAVGRIDAFVTDRIVGAMAVREKGAPIRAAGPLLYEERMGIALEKGEPKLREAINRALAAMLEDGTYRRISLQWLGIDAR